MDKETIERDRWKIWGDILGRAGTLRAAGTQGGHLYWYERVIEAVGDARECAWGTMTYACAGRKPGPHGEGGCGWEHTIHLGVGCEGPTNLKDHKATIPVPFFCGTCPDCGGKLCHVRWGDDEDFRELRPIPDDAPRFLVPTIEEARASAAQNYGGAEYIDPTGKTTQHRNRAARRQ